MGHEVHMVSITDDIEYEHAGTLFNLGKFKNKMNGPLNKLKRLYIYRFRGGFWKIPAGGEYANRANKTDDARRKMSRKSRIYSAHEIILFP